MIKVLLKFVQQILFSRKTLHRLAQLAVAAGAILGARNSNSILLSGWLQKLKLLRNEFANMFWRLGSLQVRKLLVWKLVNLQKLAHVKACLGMGFSAPSLRFVQLKIFTQLTDEFFWVRIKKVDFHFDTLAVEVWRWVTFYYDLSLCLNQGIQLDVLATLAAHTFFWEQINHWVDVLIEPLPNQELLPVAGLFELLEVLLEIK